MPRKTRAMILCVSAQVSDACTHSAARSAVNHLGSLNHDSTSPTQRGRPPYVYDARPVLLVTHVVVDEDTVTADGAAGFTKRAITGFEWQNAQVQPHQTRYLWHIRLKYR